MYNSHNEVFAGLDILKNEMLKIHQEGSITESKLFTFCSKLHELSNNGINLLIIDLEYVKTSNDVAHVIKSLRFANGLSILAQNILSLIDNKHLHALDKELSNSYAEEPSVELKDLMFKLIVGLGVKI